MQTYNFQIRRISMNEISDQLPQFSIVAIGLGDAVWKARIILGSSPHWTYLGEVTDGDRVWDFETWELL